MLSTRTISRITRVGLAIIAGCVLFLFFGNPGDHTAVILIFGAVLTAVLIAAARQKPPLQPMQFPELPPSNNFGDASWCPEITLLLPPDADGPWQGVFFGKSGAPPGSGPSGTGAPIWSKPSNHVLLIARTRTGKGTRVLLPTLLRYGLGGPDGRAGASMIVIDPKGENACISARARRLTSHVHVMNPWGVQKETYETLGFWPPATFNPLDMLDRNDPNVVSLAQAMGKAISPEDGQKEQFWATRAGQLIAATILWVIQQPGEQKTLFHVTEILCSPDFKTKYLTKLAFCNGPPTYGGAVRLWAGPFLNMPDVTYGGIIGHVADSLSFMVDPQIRAATATSSFSMNDLTGAGKDRPTTLYLVVPWSKMPIQKTWLRLMIIAGMETFKSKPPGSRYRCMFMIDEFPTLGFIEQMPTEIAAMAGAGVDFTLVVQNFGTINAIYKDRGDDIIANCAYKWFCNIDHLPTAEYLSKTLGRKTVKVTNKGGSTNENFDVKGWNDKPTGRSVGESTSSSEMGVDLLPVANVRQLGPDVAILLSPYPRPEYLWTVDYWRLQEEFAPFRPKFPSLYWPLYFDYNAVLATDPTKTQCQPQPPPPVQPGGPPIWPTDPTYNPSLYQPQPMQQPVPKESGFAIFRKLFGGSKQSQPASMTPPMAANQPAAPTKPPDLMRYFNWKPPDWISAPSTKSRGTATPPEPGPAEQPKKIDFLRFAPKSVKDHFANLPPAKPSAKPPEKPDGGGKET